MKSLRFKLMGVFFIVLAMMIGFGVFLLIPLNTATGNLQYIEANTIISIDKISTMQNVINEYRRYQFGHIVDTAAEDKAAKESVMNNNAKMMEQLFEEYEPLVSDERDREYLNDIRDKWNAYIRKTPDMLSVSRANDIDGGRQALANTLPEFNAIYEVSKEWAGYNTKLANDFVAEAQASSQRSVTIGLGLLAAAVLIGLGLSFVMSRSIARAAQLMTEKADQILRVDLPALSATASAIARGDLTAHLKIQSQPLDYKSGDEMGKLAHTFNLMIEELQQTGKSFEAMTANLRKQVSHTAEAATQVGSSATQLAQAAEQAGQATNQVAATIQEVAQGTAQQAQGMTQATSTVEQVSRAIDGVAKGAQEQATAIGGSVQLTGRIAAVVKQVTQSAQEGAQSAVEAAEAARGGAKTVQASIANMSSIKAKVGVSAGKVQEMGQRSAQIGAIVETIDDIASQTNLLALNAAIEAARAGEHGKGFAVVADEVRKLAEKSAGATKEIAGLIRSIQQTVGEAVAAMEAGSREVEVGVKQADEAGKALGDILQSVESVSGQMEGIAAAAEEVNASANELVNAMEAVSAVVEENTAATEEMAAGASEITGAIEGVASITEENSAAVQEVTAASEEMNAQVEEVAAAAQSLNEAARQLSQVVAGFKLA